jgi:hypothetical protein
LLSTFVSEPGYLQGLVPLAVAWTAVVAARSRRPRLTLIAAVLIQAAILLLPEGGKIGIKTPSIPEIINREVQGEAMWAGFSSSLRPTDRVLYITDYPGAPFQRQLPRLRPRTHVLSLFNFNPQSPSGMTLGFGTTHDLIPIPGPIFHKDVPDRTFDSQSTYDIIVLSPFLSDDLRRRLRTQTACEIPAANPGGTFTHLKGSCFPNGKIRLGNLELLFRPRPALQRVSP